MTRRTAVLVGVFAAAAAALEVIALSALLASDRGEERARYTDAIARQRRTAGRAVRVSDSGDVVSATRTSFCVRGVDTPAAAVKAELGLGIVLDPGGRRRGEHTGRLDVAALARISNLAIRGEKYVEQAIAGPALPQRLGRQRADAGGAASEWVALSPARTACENGEGFAAFQLDVPAEPTPAPAAP